MANPAKNTAVADGRTILAALLAEDASNPAYDHTLTRDDVAQLTGRTRSQVAHAVERGFLRCIRGVRDKHACSLFSPAEVRRWMREGNRVPADG